MCSINLTWLVRYYFYTIIYDYLSGWDFEEALGYNKFSLEKICWCHIFPRNQLLKTNFMLNFANSNTKMDVLKRCTSICGVKLADLAWSPFSNVGFMENLALNYSIWKLVVEILFSYFSDEFIGQLTHELFF